MNVLTRAFSYLRPYRAITVGAYIGLLGVTALNLVTPKLIEWAIDDGISRSDLNIVAYYVLVLLLLTVVRSVFFFYQNYWSEVASQGVSSDIRNDLYTHLQALSFSYHDQAQTGQLMTRALSDVEMLRFFTGRGILHLVNVLILLAGTAVVLFLTNPLLAAASLAMTPPLAFTAYRFSKVIRPLQNLVQQRLADVTTVVQENLAGMRVVKAFSREPFEIERFDRVNEQLLEANVDAFRARASSVPLMDTLGNLSTIVVLWLGGTLVIGGGLTIGELVAFNVYLAMLVQPIRRLGFLINMLSRAAVSAERVFEVLDTRSVVTEKPGAIELPPLRGDVEFDHVTFAYRRGKPILRDVSFRAEAGWIVGVLGGTGAGKSSIVNLIPRFYDVSEGCVLVDGHDVRGVTLRSLRRQIGIVLQETTLFTGTIRDNIAFGRPDASTADIERVARAARAHDFIMAFPDGYGTRVGERGATLSGGQKQRVAIARALLMDPRILILDDATASVDFETEYLIQQALAELMRDRTSFVVAQRVSSVRNANLILMLDEGRLVGAGTHAELIESCPQYTELYRLQTLALDEAAEGLPDGLRPELDRDGNTARGAAARRVLDR